MRRESCCAVLATPGLTHLPPILPAVQRPASCASNGATSASQNSEATQPVLTPLIIASSESHRPADRSHPAGVAHRQPADEADQGSEIGLDVLIDPEALGACRQ